jgi:hypothetical protein
MTNQPIIPVVPDTDALGLDDSAVDRDSDGTAVGRSDLEKDIKRSSEAEGSDASPQRPGMGDNKALSPPVVGCVRWTRNAHRIHGALQGSWRPDCPHEIPTCVET